MLFYSFASMEAGIRTPHFLWVLPKENGPCTVQKKGA